MKKRISVIFILCLICVLSACAANNDNNTEDMPEISGTTAATADEYASVLADENMNKFEKDSAVHQLTLREYETAERYRELIKEKYKETLDEYTGMGVVGSDNLDYGLMCKILDDYLDSLKNEFDDNLEFYQNQAYVLFGGGTATSSYLAEKEYYCAKAYAEKAKELYEELH